jgi:hypothetical protein
LQATDDYSASANSTYSNPSLAIDGNWENSWVIAGLGSPANPLWLQVNLQKKYQVDQINLVFAHSGTYTGYTNNYNLYTSVNGVNWNLVRSGTLVDSLDPAVYVTPIPLTSNQVFQYVKYEVVGGTHWAQLCEMELWPGPNPFNPVQVTAYVDTNSGHTYAVSYTTGALGSETGGFYGDGCDYFDFGPASPVNLVNRYSFVYRYDGSDDYYDGQAYTTVAQAQAVLNTPPSGGHYEFVDMAYGFAPTANPVQVTTYYDASAAHYYATYGATGFLGAENAWFRGIDGYPVNFGFDLAAE